MGVWTFKLLVRKRIYHLIYFKCKHLYTKYIGSEFLPGSKKKEKNIDKN